MLVMPTLGVMDSQWTLERVDFAAPEAAGWQAGVQAGFPLFAMTLTLQNMSEFADCPNDASGDDWQAFHDRCRGRIRQFYASDPKRPVPRFYRDGRGGLTARPGGWSQAINVDGYATLTLTGCAAGMVLSASDWIGFEWGATGRYLVRATGRGIADTAGSLTVPIEPPVLPLVPANAQVNLIEPTCVMRLVPEQTKILQPSVDGYYPAGSTIAAVQELRS